MSLKPIADVIRLHADDNICVAAASLKQGDCVAVGGGRITLAESIKPGHKVAVRAIGRGQEILKYGQAIGVATSDIDDTSLSFGCQHTVAITTNFGFKHQRESPTVDVAWPTGCGCQRTESMQGIVAVQVVGKCSRNVSLEFVKVLLFHQCNFMWFDRSRTDCSVFVVQPLVGRVGEVAGEHGHCGIDKVVPHAWKG